MTASQPLRRPVPVSTRPRTVRFGTAGLLCLLSVIGWVDPGRAVSILRGDIVAIASTNQRLSTIGAGPIVHIDPVTGAQSVIAPGAYIDVGLTHDGRIFAITDTELVEVQAGTGDIRTVRDLSDLGSAMGLAVGPTGALYVAYEDLATRLDGIEAIDAGSGAGSSVSPLGTFGRVGDLEFIPGGSLAALTEDPGGDHGNLYLRIVDPMTGVPVTIPGEEIAIVTGNALGVSPAGDLIAAVAFGWHGSQARELDVGTGEVFSLNIPQHVNENGTCESDPPECHLLLLRSDVAYEESGRILLGVSGFSSSPDYALRLFRLEADGTSQIVTDGAFSEVQVMVPEPSTALLLAAGVLGLAFRRRAARSAC